MGLSSLKTIWITRDGTKIRIKDMTDSHLINTIRFLRRYAEQYLKGEIDSASFIHSTCKGEMAEGDSQIIRELKEENERLQKENKSLENCCLSWTTSHNELKEFSRKCQKCIGLVKAELYKKQDQIYALAKDRDEQAAIVTGIAAERDSYEDTCAELTMNIEKLETENECLTKERDELKSLATTQKSIELSAIIKSHVDHAEKQLVRIKDLKAKLAKAEERVKELEGPGHCLRCAGTGSLSFISCSKCNGTGRSK